MNIVQKAAAAGALAVLVLAWPAFLAGGAIGTRLANEHRCESLKAQPDKGIYGASYSYADNVCKIHTLLFGDVTLPMPDMA